MARDYQAICIKEIRTGGPTTMVMRAALTGAVISETVIDLPIRITPPGEIGHFRTKAALREGVRSGHWRAM